MAGVLCLGAAPRLVGLASLPPGLSHDEAYNGVTALQVLLEGRREVFFDIYNGIEPLIIYWEAFYFWLFGISPFVMRLVNVTAGLGTIALTFALTRRLLAADRPHRAKWGAFLAALGVALSFWAIFVSRLTLRAVTLPLLEMLAFYFLWRGLTAGEAYPTRRRLVIMGLAGVGLGAAMYTYLSSRFLPIVPLAFFLYWLARGQVRRVHWLGMALFVGAWALVFGPLAVYYAQHPDIFTRRADQVLTLPLAIAGDPWPLLKSIARTLGMFSLVGPQESRYGLAGRPVFEPLGALFFHIGLLVTVTRLRRPAREAAGYAFLLIWWLVMLIPAFITGESPHYLRSIGSLPPTYVMWALGIISVGEWLLGKAGGLRQITWPKRTVLAALALYLVFSGVLTVRDYFVCWAGDAQARAIYGAEFSQIVSYLARARPQGPLAISSAYYRDWDRFRLDVQTGHHPPYAIWFHGPQTLLLPPPHAGVQPTYIFAASAPPHPYWLDWLQLEVAESDMAVYRLRHELPALADRPLDAVIGTGDPTIPELVRLLGYQLVGEARAGQPLQVLLRWQALRDVPGDPDYAFFAQLRDKRGFSWAQADANGYAVVDWQPGVIALQWLTLRLPPDLPPLEYGLWLGLQDRSAGRALPVVGQPGTTGVLAESLVPAPAASPPTPETFAVPNPSALDVAGLFILRGHDISPRFGRPGDRLHVSLFWEAQREPPADYRLTLWLMTPDGTRIDLDTRQPLAGEYPTSRWSAGQWVRDRFDILIPAQTPPGLYRVFAAWRDAQGAWLGTADRSQLALGEVYVASRD